MKYYCVKQHDITDCGAACLATISRHYGLKIPISQIRDMACTNNQGTNVYGIIKAAENLGFTAKGVKGNQNAFFSSFPLPAIAHVVTEKNLLHYIVIYKITKKEIIVSDPAKGMVKYTPEEFFKNWTGILIVLVPSATFKKYNKNENTFSSFISLLKPQKKLILNIFLTSIIITIFGILTSFYFKVIVDSIVPNFLNRTLTIISVCVIVLYVVKILMEFFRNQLMLYLTQRIDIPLILGFYQHVLKLPMRFFDSHKVGEIVSRFIDASKIRDTISSATLTIMIDTVMAVVGGIVLYIQSPKLFTISLIMLLLYGIVVFLYNKPIKNINKKVMEENSQLTSFLVESISGIETIKSFNCEKKSEYKTETLFIKFLKSVFHNGFLSNSQQSITNAIAVIGGTIILWVGTLDVLSGNFTLGQLITFNALLIYFLDPIKNLINLQPLLQTAIVAANRLGEILDLSTEYVENKQAQIKDISLRLPIYISNLNFRYGSQQLVLKDINMSIPQGKKIALVGESGSGKTTLAKLLMHFHNLESGDIKFGNYSINDIDLHSLRDKISYVSQEVFLFNGSIIENLTLGDNSIPFEKVIDICKLTKADEFIEKLPLRYNTIIDENGSNLSGGQKQRIAIARALLKNPDILILDEATSNLDSITEKAISKTIDEVSNNITTIIIAHRLSTIKNCDTIYVLEDGKIIENGTHKDLINSNGAYYNLWKDQIDVHLGGDKVEN